MTKQARTLDDRQEKAALATCKSARERALLLLSTRAGLRAKEIAGLRWSAVDLDAGMLLLSVTKGDKARQVPVANGLLAALRELRAADPAGVHVFTNTQARPGAPLTPNAVAGWFRDFYKRLNWQGYSSHSGRRTFITKAARGIMQHGGSLRDVQALAGHADLATTARYIETNADAQAAWIKAQK